MRSTILGVMAAALLAVPGALEAQATQQGTAAAVAAPAAVTAEMLAKARLEGQSAAQNAGGWFGRSVAIGVFTGLIGTAVTYGVAANSGVELPAEKKLEIAGQPAAYQEHYEKAYADKVRSKRKSTALGGGILGTAAFVVLLVSSAGSGN